MRRALSRVREATLQFSDVFGEIPASSGEHRLPLVDFDAILTSTVRNDGHFTDTHFPIGAWPQVGDYGAVLVEELRRGQRERATEAGLVVGEMGEGSNLHDLHPDLSVLMRSLLRAVVVVVNSAPRTAHHHASNENGDEFYVALTTAGIEIYSQLPFLTGLASRGWIEHLYRIPNGSGAWTDGEQFRSSCVTQVRTRPDLLVSADLSLIPSLGRRGRLAYVDTFGNVRLEMRDGAATRRLLSSGGSVNVHLEGASVSLAAHCVKRLTEIPEGEVGIYLNPVDEAHVSGPCYVELVRRVSSPNGCTTHAYASLRATLPTVEAAVALSSWDARDISLSRNDGVVSVVTW